MLGALCLLMLNWFSTAKVEDLDGAALHEARSRVVHTSPDLHDGPDRVNPLAEVARSVSFRVIDDVGGPVSGVRVALASARIDPESGVDGRIDPSLDQAGVRWLIPDGEERFSIPIADASPDINAMLVALAPGFEVKATPINEFIDGRVSEIQLSARNLDVQVSAGGGEPVTDAVVLATYVVRRRVGSVSFRSEVTIEAKKSSQQPIRIPFSDDAVVAARALDFRSPTESADGRVYIELSVLPTFGVRLRLPLAASATAYATYRIDAQLGGESKELVSGAIDAAEGGGEIIVPYTGPFRYLISCYSSDWAAMPQEIERPIPGANYEVLLESAGGRSWIVHVVDGESKPIVGATVTCAWVSPSGRAIRTSRSSDAVGEVRFCGLPDALVDFWAKKGGYLQREPANAWTNYPEETPTRITLLSGCQLDGIVLSGGRPVTEFSVWCSVAGGPWIGRSFTHVSDGRFAIRGLMPGVVEAFAFSHAHGQSELISAELDCAATAPIELHIPVSTTGSLRVVDAVTAKAVDGATAEILVCVGGSVVAASGALYSSGPDGRILIDGISPGTNRVAVTAPGFERLSVSGFQSGESALDFGTIELRRSGSLAVAVTSDGPIKLDWCSIAVVGGVVLPRLLLGTDGTASFDGVSPGRNRIEITRPDDAEEVLIIDLDGGGARKVEVPIAVRASSRVELSSELALKADGVEVFHRRRPNRIRSTYVRTSGRDVLAIPIDSSEAEEIELTDANGRRLLRRQLTSQEKTDGVFRLESSRDLTVRVTGSSGYGIQGCTVLVRRRGGDADVALSGRSGEDGRALIFGVGWDWVEVLVYHPQIGVRPSESVSLESLGGGELELVLAPVGRAMVVVKDGEVALPGVEVRFLDPKYNAGRMTTNDDGVVWSLPLQGGKYRAEAGGGGYWPSSMEIECDREEVRASLQVRRTGGLELELHSASGRDVRIYTFELKNSEFDTSVAQWLEVHKVISPQGGRPDKDGRLDFYGLPNGRYSWTALLDGIGMMSGQVHVEPHTVIAEKLFLP